MSHEVVCITAVSMVVHLTYFYTISQINFFSSLGVELILTCKLLHPNSLFKNEVFHS
jgi:hypothetical protein